jgi:hypothetical protein
MFRPQPFPGTFSHESIVRLAYVNAANPRAQKKATIRRNSRVHPKLYVAWSPN